MSDPQRTEPADHASLSEADRAARIEQLLLSGLDQYFGGSYEQAINIWTRVAFLERGHGRARAYIDRARAALAERQRLSEEALHDGITAYQEGDLTAARTLLTQAVEQGGALETALPLLERLGRLDAARAPRVERQVARGPAARRMPARTSMRHQWWSTLLASVAVAVTILAAVLYTASWLRESPAAPRVADAAPEDPLPLASGAEIRLRRAESLRDAGRLREALAQVEAIEIGDPLRPEAERVRAEIQREVLSAFDETASPAGEQGR
jgi:hypothetical protein